MSVKIKTILQSPLAVGACVTAVVTVVGTAYALIYPRPGSTAAWLRSPNQANCRTVVFDPKPPLNVRSTPSDKPGNIVGSLLNDQEVTIEREQDGWIQIKEPVQGWIYQNLTKTICDNQKPGVAFNVPASPAPDDLGSKMLRQASAQFQAGNLKGAMALAKAVPEESPAYSQAQVELRTMPRQWDQAKVKYDTAREALENRRWSDVLTIVTEFPDIRYWRQQLTPVVKQAILMQHLMDDQPGKR
jgi:hypothetical protein